MFDQLLTFAGNSKVMKVQYGVSFAVLYSVTRLDIGFKVHYVMLCLLCILQVYTYYILHTRHLCQTGRQIVYLSAWWFC
ncbi:hypothetical protein Hanom_Chr16g01480641 [Helianthus anomalus]